ncbi:radical SAM protein [Thermodesulfobacteriota bacterium]
MLTGIHFILTYACNFECDHCFLYSSPRSKGTFTISQVVKVLNEAQKIGTVEWIFYEGGEPFLFFPLLNESIKLASAKGFKVGVVTNAYGANSEEDAELWLRPLAESGLSFLNISNDTFHYGEEPENPATIASSASRKLDIDTSPICIEPPKVIKQSLNAEGKGHPVIGGGAKFRGRAVEKLAKDLPLRPWSELVECPYEDLESPSRVHIDPYGNVQICQGISIGNMWITPLSELLSSYRSKSHPICGPLIQGGPAELAKKLGVVPEAGYIDECHFCYLTRRTVIDEFPDYLAPRQVYGLE